MHLIEMIEKKRKEVRKEVAAILKRGMGRKNDTTNADNDNYHSMDMDAEDDVDEVDMDVDVDAVAAVDKENVAILPGYLNFF